MNGKFFGSKVAENLKYFDQNSRKEFERNVIKCYERTIKYLCSHFDYDTSPFRLFSKLNLDSNLKYNDLIEISTKLRLNIDKDMLFDKIDTVNTLLSELNSIESNSDVITKYCKLLSKSDLINILKIIESVLAIPIGTNFVERVFTHMNKIWTDERNRMSIGLIKAEICIKKQLFSQLY